MSDDWLTPFDGSGIEWHESLPNPYTYKASDFSALVAAVHEYECRAESAERQLQETREALAAASSQLRREGYAALADRITTLAEEAT